MTFGKFVNYIWNIILGVLSSIRPTVVDVLDIIIVAFIIYKIIQLIRETRAEQLLKGSGILLIAYLVARWLHMESMMWIFNNIIFQVGITALVVVFQPELRRALERVGRSNFGNIGRGLTAAEAEATQRACIDAVSKACASLSKTKTGALIVFERKTMLGEMINTGTVLDAASSTELIMNVFYPKSPLHDGAMIIRDAKLHAAGCILPLTQNAEISRELGTRHRAAIGMSENSDAIVVVVSEETGTISVARDGQLTRDFNQLTLYSLLETALMGDRTEQGGGRIKAIKRKLHLGGKKPNE